MLRVCAGCCFRAWSRQETVSGAEGGESDNTPVLIERLERLLNEIDVKRNGLEPVPSC
jgi:hypothetical protein